MDKIIELKNLTKNYGDQQVLRGINLDIQRLRQDHDPAHHRRL